MNIIKRKAMSILEGQLGKEGYILAIRAWEPATLFEIDVHLPQVNMEEWKSVQHIKVKVAEFTYRDYTPTLWDAETHSCTLLINTSQESPGSLWVKSLKAGDVMVYMGVASAHHKPVAGKRLLCLGDSTSIGHFLALQQLAGCTAEIYGAVSFRAASHLEEFASYFDTRLQAIQEKNWDYSLVSWLEQQTLSDETVYIVGHIPTSQQIRKHLKQRDDFKGTIKLQGFWG